MKFKTSAIFFFIFILSCTPKNRIVNKSEKVDCINYILSEDEKYGKIRNHACESKAVSKVIEEYILALESLDYDLCPKEFTRAFQAHINAWKNIIPVVSNYDDQRAEMHDLFDFVEKGPHTNEFKIYLELIWSTWTDVEQESKLLNH